jgi:hypothetical protein
MVQADVHSRLAHERLWAFRDIGGREPISRFATFVSAVSANFAAVQAE